jgi:hypothetical protein
MIGAKSTGEVKQKVRFNLVNKAAAPTQSSEGNLRRKL